MGGFEPRFESLPHRHLDSEELTPSDSKSITLLHEITGRVWRCSPASSATPMTQTVAGSLQQPYGEFNAGLLVRR